MKNFMEIMNFRHACKIFDENKKISEKDFEYILEGARLSPSSFGLEPWHFLVIENQKIKEALRPSIWNQPQVTSSSHFVIILSKKAEFFARGSAYLDEAFKRKVKDNKEMLEAVKGAFLNFSENELKPDLVNWAKMQTYIAGANMMNAAASIGIDSCPIEGFPYKALHEALLKNVPAFDDKKYNISFCIAFGYRVNEQPAKIRWPLNKIATFVK
ncbi:MAG: NAD(P)H-dependent oxidoreductase [Campylobacteraceae bacterium]